MADNTEKGILLIIGATIFLLSGLELLDLQIFEPEFSMLLAFILVAAGVYLLAKK